MASEELKEYIIHPRRRLIIRPNTLTGFEGVMCMDKLTKKFKHDSEMVSEDGLTPEEMLDKYRGTGAGRSSIPEDGWMKVYVEDLDNLEGVFEDARKLKKKDRKTV